jgi:monothiol glutaredoxin
MGAMRHHFRRMDEATRSRIQTTIDKSPVVLFMKGTRTMPQCGFSARVVQMIDQFVPEYETVNVLADAEVRQAIKDFSDWPTIPQLYVKGEFIGGCDIVTELFESGQLEQMLGGDLPEVQPPVVHVSEEARAALSGAVEPGEFVRLEVDARYQHSLSVGERGPKDLSVKIGDFELLVDRGSARRAEGVSIEYVDSASGKAFKITNPNEPPKVKPIDARELKLRLDRGEVKELFDVRTPAERQIASIAAARLLDRPAQDHILSLPKSTPLYFHCHHGGRSGQAAEFFLNQGFTEVYNLEGGIDAWARDVDPDVPRY